MEPTTIRLPDDVRDEIDAEASEHGVTTAEYIRKILQHRERALAYDDELDELRDRVEAIERALERS